MAIPYSFNELKEKAIHGDAEAQHEVGQCYEKGNGVFKDVIDAMYWYQLSADQGHPKGQAGLANLYLGNHDDIAMNLNLAKKWSKLAMDQGDQGGYITYQLASIEEDSLKHDQEFNQELQNIIGDFTQTMDEAMKNLERVMSLQTKIETAIKELEKMAEDRASIDKLDAQETYIKWLLKQLEDLSTE